MLRRRVPRSTAAAKSVTTADGTALDYDALVLATGSYAFVPPVPGHDLPQLPRLSHARRPRRHPRRRAGRAGSKTPVGVVIGGGLLGLEAANALRAFGLTTHVVEMVAAVDGGQQLDEAGGALLTRMIGGLGIEVHTGVGTESIEPVQRNKPLRKSEADDSCACRSMTEPAIDAGLVVFAAGVRPRDELARARRPRHRRSAAAC